MWSLSACAIRSWLVVAIVVAQCAHAVAANPKSMNDLVSQLDLDTSRVSDVISVFGPPQSYVWGEQTLDPNNLPDVYVMVYPNGFDVFIQEGWILELRFENASAGYIWQHGIHIGTSLQTVLADLGPPAQTIVGQGCDYEDGVLYEDIQTAGDGYWRRSDLRVRFFFANYAVACIYVTRTNFENFEPPQDIAAYDDVRDMDLRSNDLSTNSELPRTLTFNTETRWPPAAYLPVGFNPQQVMEASRNPGLGVRALHSRGITGVGVNVAIIDQPLPQDHSEYAGKFAAYFDVGTGQENSMHGPAVASLLVGSHCGTAPGARLCFVAAPSWLQDSSYYAAALDWIVSRNATLPDADKVRVVSVSAMPSGQGSPFLTHLEMWDPACARAEAAGIAVLDCTAHRGFIGTCWYDADAPESMAACTPGFPGMTPYFAPDHILAPSSLRTTAECYEAGMNNFIYWGRGGLSWSIPYVTGVLALGWQVNAGLSASSMIGLLKDSAWQQASGAKIVDPSGFIAQVERRISVRHTGFLVAGEWLGLYAATTGHDYQWMKNGYPIAENAPRVSGVNARTLIFAPLDVQDSGSYTCTFNNGIAQVTSAPYSLDVQSRANLPAASFGGLALLMAGILTGYGCFRRPGEFGDAAILAKAGR